MLDLWSSHQKVHGLVHSTSKSGFKRAKWSRVMIFSVQAMQGHLKTRNFDGEKPGILMGILAVHITTVKIRDTKGNQASLGHLGHPGQIGVGWVPQNDVTMEAVRHDYFPSSPVGPNDSTQTRTITGRVRTAS